MPSQHDELLARWRGELEALRTRVEALVAPLTPLERRQTPAPRAWNVDQVLEHLTIANGLYAAAMAAALDSGAASTSGADAAAPWKPTMVGKLLRRAVDPRSARRTRSPRRSRPGPDVRSDVLARFTAGLTQLDGLMARAAGTDLNAVRFASPLAAIVRLNLGDGFAICTAHTARHTAQIERTIDAVRP